MPKASLDAIDLAMLSALQQDGRLPNVDLADRVGLSASPCGRRLKRLEQDGVVTAYRAVLDRAAVGLGLTVFVGLKVEAHRDENAEAVERAVAAVPEVVSCHLVAGEMDYRLEVVVEDLEAYERFLRRVLLRLPGVHDIRSTFAIKTVKANAPLPLPGTAATEKGRSTDRPALPRR